MGLRACASSKDRSAYVSTLSLKRGCDASHLSLGFQTDFTVSQADLQDPQAGRHFIMTRLVCIIMKKI